MNFDRRDIAPLLVQWFPSMEGATSEEWHYFLDKLTDLGTPLDMPNGHAFDRWRDALAKLGYPVFAYSAADLAAMKVKAEAALAAEQERAASLGKTLVDLAKEAPNWPVAEVLAKAKG